MPSPDSHKKKMTEAQVTPVTTKPEAKTAKAAEKPKAKPKRTSATKAKTVSTAKTSTTPLEAKDTTAPEQPLSPTANFVIPTLASALGSARLATTTKKGLTAKEMDAKLEEKLTKAHAGQAVPETDTPTSENPAPWTQAHGEASGLPPITTVRPMPEVTVKAPKKSATKKATAKAPAKATTKTTAKATAKSTTAAKTKVTSPVASQSKKTTTKKTAEPVVKTTEATKAKPTAKTTGAKKTPAKKVSSTSTTAKAKKQAEPKTSNHKTADKAEKADAKEASSPNTGLLATLINVAPSGIDDAVAKAKTTSNETAEVTTDAPITKSLKKVDQPIKPEDVPQEGQTLAFLADDGLLPIDDEEAAAQKDTKVSKQTTTAPTVAEASARPQASTTSKTIVLNTLDDDSDDEDDEPFVADADDTIDTNDERRYHDTVTLTGRRAPVKGQIKDPEPVLPKTVDLEEERIAAQAVAKATLDRRHAERLVKRDELEARLSKRGLKAMCRESGIPEAAIDQLETHQLIQKRDAKTDHAPQKANEQRNLTEGVNPLWRNDAVRACNEHLERTTAIRPPVYNFAAGDEAQPTIDPRVAAAQQYAEAMVAWENQVIGESKTDRLLSPDRDKEPGKRIPVVTPANETLGGFPGAKDMRPWVSVSGKPAQTMPLTLGEKVDLYRYKANLWLSRWRALDALLRTSLVALGCAIVAAATSVSTSYWLVPELTWRHTPVTVTALVADDEIRDLMMLVSLLETQKVDIGRTSPTVNRAYLPTAHLDRLANDTPDVRKTLPLDDALLRAAITEVSNRVGAPVISKKMVLATPESTYHAVGRTLDVTDDVIDLLGLTGVSAAAAKEALNGLMSPNGKPVTEKLQSDRLSGRIPLGQLTTPEK